MTRVHQQSCPIAASLNEIGDMWTLMIVREAMYGETRFSQIQRNTGIARNLLASRLEKMIENGILECSEIGKAGQRHEYRLTAKGRAIAPILVAVSQWGNQWIYGEGNEPVKLTDRKSGAALAPLAPSLKDGTKLDWRDVQLTMGPGATGEMRTRFQKSQES